MLAVRPLPQLSNVIECSVKEFGTIVIFESTMHSWEWAIEFLNFDCSNPRLDSSREHLIAQNFVP
jgi:hypothetical protein